MNRFDMKDLTPFARERLTVSTTNKQLTPATYLDEANYGKNSHFFAKAAKLKVEGANGIWLDETGDTPSATVGVSLTSSSDPYWIVGLEAIRKVTMQRSGAADAAVEVVYYR